jgi:regulator of sigma E protease
MCLIAALDWSALPWWVPVVPAVALGLGAVIFVHELGHFLVAKACGVKCEKFFIGFDVGGYKISRKWGETEYGIGILPLGGYVKMLGQDDNPANIAEQVRESQVAGNTAGAKEITGPDGQKYLVDKRSYLAKSVPQRMAIISAGVIMNVIFAFIFATVAYKIGVPYNPSIVSGTAPGSPAWRAGLQPDDEILQVGKIRKPSYDELRGSVMLGDLERGVDFVIERDGQTINKTLKPEQGANKGLARVGITPPISLKVGDEPVIEGSPAVGAEPTLKAADVITRVNGEPVNTYAEFAAIATRDIGKPLSLTVRRMTEDAKASGGEAGASQATDAAEELVIQVPPRPWRSMGLVMQMGKVTAVQEGSPADTAGVKAGDYIDRVSAAGDGPADENILQDPVLLPEDLRRLSLDAQEVRLHIRPATSEAEGRQGTVDVVVPLREAKWLEEPIAPDDPVSLPSLGLAYRVLNVVEHVEPGSAADKAGLKAEDVITAAEVVLPKDSKIELDETTVKFSSDEKTAGANWPQFITWLQRLPQGTQVKLTYARGNESKTTDPLTPDASSEYFEFERGISFELINKTRIAETWGEAWQLGRQETVRSLGMVYRFLRKLGAGQVPLTALGGPVTIAKGAGFSAFEGPGKLLVFLTMLSANLAVINFLPIPLLDGGHMVFLAWEGLRGRPASERFVVAMHTVGFVFIITLMLFVISLDIGLIPRNL